jgi:hypothetical protein
MGENKNKVTLTVETLSGSFSDEFNVHQTLEHVTRAAMKELAIVQRPNERWVLKYGERELTLSQTIQEAGLPDGAVLQFAAVEGGGGAWTLK